MSNGKTFAEKLQSVPKFGLYLVLIAVTSLPLIYSEATHQEIKVPNEPDKSTQDLYGTLMTLPEGSPVLIQSDWTNSTRGESGGQFESLVKILAARKLKAVIYSAGDPQAPQVAANTIATINATRREKKLPEYKRYDDWVNLGYFPNGEGTLNSMASDIKSAFSGRKEVNPATGNPVSVFATPPFKTIGRAIGDFPLMVVVTASNTSMTVVERLNGKLPLGFMVTGVMGPETLVYYSSGQLVGMSNGLKGVYDLETMMTKGLNTNKWKDIAPMTDGMSEGKGSAYYPTLHGALALLIVAVAAGNIGMFLSRKGGNKS